MTKEECEIGTSKAIMEMRSRIVELEKENAELEKEKCELLGIIQGKDKVIQELKKELNNMLVSKNQQLTKAKEIIRDLLQVLPKENIEGIYEITEEAEQFLRESK